MIEQRIFCPGANSEGARKFLGKERIMEKWVCQVCGYVYDPEVGDDEGGIPPGTPFEELPDDWSCPVCGASKEEFEKQT